MPHLHWRGNALQDLAQQARKARDSSSSSRSGSSSDASSSSSSSSRSIASTVCAAGLSAAGETCPGSGAAACQALLPVSSTRPGSRPPRAVPPPAGTKAGAWRGGRKAEQAAGQGLALLPGRHSGALDGEGTSPAGGQEQRLRWCRSAGEGRPREVLQGRLAGMKQPAEGPSSPKAGTDRPWQKWRQRGRLRVCFSIRRPCRWPPFLPPCGWRG